MAEVRGAGKGAGGDGGGGHESDDTLFSSAYVEVIEAVCEGTVRGLANGGNSVYMNGTPVIAADGTPNHNVAWQTLNGWPVQTGFPALQSASAENQVDAIVLQATPVEAAITAEAADFAVVTVGFPRLMSGDDKGNIYGSGVDFKIEYQPYGGAWMQAARNSARLRGVFFPPATYYTSPPTAFAVEVMISLSQSQEPVGLLHSLDGVAWTPLGQVHLSPTQLQWPGWFHGAATFPLPEGVNCLKFDGAAPGLKSVWWHSYTPGGIVNVTGKSMSRYQKQYRFPLAGSAPWQVRVTRVTADSNSVKLANELWFDSVRTETSARLGYPNTALIRYRIPAKEFPAIPRRRAEWKLLEVRIPSNYNPLTRAYTGVWDGSFKLGWTDNPAWCFYDLCLSPRYGLGRYLAQGEIDKWALYAIGKYCDGLVDSGSRDQFGAVIYEPRFTLNILINQTREAFEWLRDMASVFRGMMYVINGVLTVAGDLPADAGQLFTPANVINGQFKFSGTGALARKTVAMVQWRDPADMYNAKVEYVQDRAGILRYGINETSVIAVGCTSRGQAHRLGKFVLLDGEVMTFGVGHEAATVQPGDVIQCAVPLRSGGKRLGGRLNYMIGTEAILDAPVSLVAGHSYQLSVVLADGSVNSRAVVFPAAVTTDTLTLAAALDGPVVDRALWALVDLDGVQPTLWRVLGITEGEGFTATISALSHDPGKYAKIDSFDAAIDASLLSAVNPQGLAAVTGITIDNLPFTDKNGLAQNKLHAHWAQAPQAAGYQLRWRLNGGNWHKTRTLVGPLFELTIKDDGVYEIEVVALNVLGVQSPPASASATITGAASEIGFDAQWGD